MNRFTIMRRFFPILIFLLVPIVMVDGAVFLRKKGEGFVSSEYWRYQTARFWDDQGNRLPSNNVYKKDQFITFVEYGLTDNYTIWGQARYDWIRESIRSDTDGFEDFECGVIAKFKEKRGRLISLYLTGIIPGGKYDPAIRYGRSGLEGGVGAGSSFVLRKCGEEKYYAFWSLRAGFRGFFGFPSDQFRADVIAGHDLTKKFQIIAGSFLEYGIYNGKPKVGQNNIVFDSNYRLLKGFLLGRLKISEKLSIIAAYNRHLWGRNTGTGGGLYTGLWYEF